MDTTDTVLYKTVLYKREVYALIGAAMEVYNVLGPGFLEAVYQEALERELRIRSLPFESQKRLRIYYKGEPLNKYYTPDLVIYGCIVVELKAADQLDPFVAAQLLNYLRATGIPLGVIVNFGSSPRLQWKRMILTPRAPTL